MARKYPEYFVDVDDLLLFKGEYRGFDEIFYAHVQEKYGVDKDHIKDLNFLKKLSLMCDNATMFTEWIRSKEVDERDRRVLLTHVPNNTKRSIAGIFVLSEPTNIRNNVAGRNALMTHPDCVITSFEGRERRCLNIVEEKEPEVFRKEAFIAPIVRSCGHFTSRLSN